MPFLSTALAIGGIAAAGAGVGESVSASGAAQDAAGANTDIARQELQDKQKIFNQLQPFYSPYLEQGSPYLQNIQRAGAEQNAQQGSQAAGQLRQGMQETGLGYGPSGTTAAALGQLGQAGAQQSANTYLSNLLNNEQVKFQAAQGLSGIGNMMSQQNTVGATPQPVQSTVGSSVNAFGQSLQNLFGQNNTNSGAAAPGTFNPFGFGTGAPTTQGTPVGG